jgi:FtsZ-interacting cell division protein ZipA
MKVLNDYMTDLQVGLIVGGLVIIGAIYGLNWWQEHRYKKTTAKTFAKNHPDVLLTMPKNMVRAGVENQATQRYEPSFAADGQEDEALPETTTSGEFQPALVQHTTYQDKADPPIPSPGLLQIDRDKDRTIKHELSLEEKETSSLSSLPLRSRAFDLERDAFLSPAFHFIAEIHAKTPINATLMPILSAAKRVRCLGLRADKQWEVITEGSLGHYDELKIGLQLVDRQGAVTQEDINAFCQTIQLFADECEANVIFPHRAQKLQQAQELDQFCAETDVQIGLNLKANANLSLEKIAAFAEQEKMTLAADGAFHLTDESGNTLFSLVNQDGQQFTPNFLGETRAISFVLDVPRVAHGGEVFDHMCQLAWQLAEVLQAELVDDKQQTLTAQSLALIRQELVHMQNKMQTKDIEAGSTIALQLYA